MKIITFVVVLSLISATASADVFKCKDADGHTSFQESPCTNSVSGSTKVTLPASKVNSNPSQTTSAAIAKGNNEAYNSAMANKDYNKALMFASTDQQRSQVKALKSAHDTRCAELSIKAVQARADSKQLNGRYQHAADAAQAIYDTECSQ